MNVHALLNTHPNLHSIYSRQKWPPKQWQGFPLWEPSLSMNNVTKKQLTWWNLIHEHMLVKSQNDHYSFCDWIYGFGLFSWGCSVWVLATEVLGHWNDILQSVVWLHHGWEKCWGWYTKGIRFDGLVIVVFPLFRVWNSWPLALWQGHKWVRGSHGQAGF